VGPSLNNLHPFGDVDQRRGASQLGWKLDKKPKMNQQGEINATKRRGRIRLTMVFIKAGSMVVSADFFSFAFTV
jgi:hypothetical protein